MKRRLILNALLFCVSASMVAQTSNKLTLDARMQVEKHQVAKRTRAAAAASAGTLSAIIKLDETRADKTLVVPKDETMGRVRAAENFVKTLQKREKPLNTPDEAVRLMKIIDAIYASAKTGAPVRIR